MITGGDRGLVGLNRLELRAISLLFSASLQGTKGTKEFVERKVSCPSTAWRAQQASSRAGHSRCQPSQRRPGERIPKFSSGQPAGRWQGPGHGWPLQSPKAPTWASTSSQPKGSARQHCLETWAFDMLEYLSHLLKKYCKMSKISKIQSHPLSRNKSCKIRAQT